MIEIDGEKYQILKVQKLDEGKVELEVKHVPTGVVEYMIIDGETDDLQPDEKKQ